MPKKVTIQDIADALGVSRNTVSKAINNGTGLADATREKVLQKAVEMGYKQFSYFRTVSGFSATPDASREGRGPKREISLLTAQFLNQSHFASAMLDSFQQEISELGYTMNTHRIREEHLTKRTLPATFSRERAAAILCIEVFDRPYAEMLCALGLPTLFVDGPAAFGTPCLPADRLCMDNTSEVARFVREMAARGKTRIGFVGNRFHCASFFERYSAFQYAMLMDGHSVEERYCVDSNGKAEIERGIRSMRELPEVFLCANDFVAMDVLHTLRDMGKSVPGDVWLCGFDDSPESGLISPPLTTIHIHTQIMAFSAVHLLFSRIKEPNLDYREIRTQTDLIWRESTGGKPEENRT
ncbi:MAG: LacI family DNA-binding transcriptional regulator [Oscillibacter sp.]|nr:LacI family DNA-binding transcriptional regulator [Oscillibacter sp.]